MPITDTQVAALRAFLVRDTEETVPLAYQLGDEAMQGYVLLSDAALSVAAGRRFSPTFTSADLVRYVASVRSSRLADGDQYDFDPIVGETVLRHSLGQTVTQTLELEPRLRAVITLLDALAETELSSEADLDDLLAEARQLADRWWLRVFPGTDI
jgi:hypothetical protein